MADVLRDILKERPRKNRKNQVGGDFWFQESQKVEEVKMTANPAWSVDGRTDSQSGQRHFPKGNSREAVHCATCQAT